MTERRISREEIAAAFEERSEDIFVSSAGFAFFLGGQIAGRVDGGNPDWPAIRKWMDEQHYWPNVWYFTDHGNAELVDIDESGNATFLGGLV